MTAPFSADLDVSRETTDRLRQLERLLIKWNPAINLVSKATLPQVWDRHIVDSAQIYRLAPPASHWVDLGSGGGFPGLVIACLAAELCPNMKVTLVESDQRKATFLREAARELLLKTNVISARIETVDPLFADVLSARALAPLSDLLAYANRHMRPDGVALFPKGASWRDEVARAQEGWHFDCDTHPSATDPHGAILAVKAIRHV
jgi:16S rRNA (guanine527-N7)-methyltransferase